MAHTCSAVGSVWLADLFISPASCFKTCKFHIRARFLASLENLEDVSTLSLYSHINWS